MQRQLLSEPNLDLSRACELAQGMEAANKDAKEMQILPTGANEESSTNRVGTGSSKPCSRCLGVGHLPSECRFNQPNTISTRSMGTSLKLAEAKLQLQQGEHSRGTIIRETHQKCEIARVNE